MAVSLIHVNKMVALAQSKGFTVTSTTGGQHNAGSLHARGLAIDVRTKDKTTAQGNEFIKFMQDSGYKVRDERAKPAGQKVWSGPHIHIEVKPIAKAVAVAATGGGALLILTALFFF